MPARPHAILVGLFLLAGCVSPSTPDEPPSEYGEPFTRPLDYFDAIGCEEGGGGTTTPPGIYGNQPPHNWEQGPIDDVSFKIRKCARVSWGSLERPLSMVWELHHTYSPPDSCRHEDYGWTEYLATLVMDDPDFVRQARTFGLPAFLGKISLAKKEQGGVQTWEWEWQVEGNPKSTLLNVAAPGLASNTSLRDLERFVWFPEGGGVSYFDTTFVGSYDAGTQPIVYGTIASPMMYSNAGSPFFAGFGRLREGAYSATMHRFGDLECKNPLDS